MRIVDVVGRWSDLERFLWGFGIIWVKKKEVIHFYLTKRLYLGSCICMNKIYVEWGLWQWAEWGKIVVVKSSRLKFGELVLILQMTIQIENRQRGNTQYTGNSLMPSSLLTGVLSLSHINCQQNFLIVLSQVLKKDHSLIAFKTNYQPFKCGIVIN